MNKETFEWSLIEVAKVRGNQGVTTCPVCSHTRKKKNDKCLSVNIEKGVAHCFHCEAISIREDETSINIHTKKSYAKVPELISTATNYSEGMITYMKGRNILKSTLNHFYISEENYLQPALQKKVNNIVFNYYEGSSLVNKKYRSADKKFTQTVNGKPILYNINSIIGKDTCYIVEGEFDVLAMYEIGIKNCVSLPNGANDNDNYWINSKKYIEGIKHFIIATDNDEKGIEVREKIAQRLGKYRCTFLIYKNKDANDDLIEGVLEDTVKNEQKFTVNGTFTSLSMERDVMDLYRNGLPDTIKPKHHSFDGVNNIFSLMRGHLCTTTGIPSHGKSAYVEWYTLNLVNDLNMKASFFSPEHSPIALHNTNFMQMATGKTFFNPSLNDYTNTPRMTEEDIHNYNQWADEKLYFTTTDSGDTPTWDWLLAKFREQIFNFGIDIFVIDAFNKVQLDKGNKIDSIGRALTDLTSFAQANNVIVILIAHPTKMKKDESTGLYPTPNLYDVSGSADFRNQTHDGFTIYRHFGEDKKDRETNYLQFINLKTKMKFQGEIGGMVDLEYHNPTGRFFPRGHDYVGGSIFDKNERIETNYAPLPTMSPGEVFSSEEVEAPYGSDVFETF